MEIRRATADDIPAIARVRVDTWRTSYAGALPAEYLAGLTHDDPALLERWRRAIADERPERLVSVAEDAAAGVVAYLSAGREAGGDPLHTGEVYAIYVLPAHQGRGIGRELMRVAATHLAAHGLASLLVWTLRRGPSRPFYEALGGRVVRERHEPWEKGLVLDEVGYGWDDLAPLIAR